jgi:hypothetical protein
LRQGDAAYWSGRAPNLFPYAARLTGGGYYMDGRLYGLPEKRSESLRTQNIQNVRPDQGGRMPGRLHPPESSCF